MENLPAGGQEPAAEVHVLEPGWMEPAVETADGFPGPAPQHPESGRRLFHFHRLHGGTVPRRTGAAGISPAVQTGERQQLVQEDGVPEQAPRIGKRTNLGCPWGEGEKSPGGDPATRPFIDLVKEGFHRLGIKGQVGVQQQDPGRRDPGDSPVGRAGEAQILPGLHQFDPSLPRAGPALPS